MTDSDAPENDGSATNVDIAKLRNLGPRSCTWLQAVGINTLSDLKQIGPVMAYKMIQDHGFAPSLNLVYAMAAALRNEHWTTLSPEEKAQLKAAVT